ncbi:hypothetical protein AB0383_16640 [Amycolatopsis sp. NPDC051373]|uniref:hypothetical protein n=1 Tax=Amycolatopsis sp. NPDC051373 TaxID=3155801 RepID=UPI00344EC126
MLLVVLCVGGAVWWTTASENRVAVLATAHPVSLGHVLAPVDLRSVEVSVGPGLVVVPADQARMMVGRAMATSLGAGALLTPDAVGAAVTPAAGRAVVAVGMTSGQYPPELAAGATVAVIVTQSATTAPSTTGEDAAAGTSWPGTVVGVSEAGSDQTTVVSLELDTVGATELAQVPAGRVALVLQPAGGGR